jgi:DNA-binding winged helix-turn-helix (wHTH) protein/tetratricopeptide (TPR) repeat protein
MDRSVRDKGAYRFGPFRLDPERRTLSRDGAPLAITPTVFDILLYLVEHADRVVSKEEMLDQVWPQRTVEESNIRQGVFTLRKALGEDGARLIVTAPGQGYRFAAAVSRDAGIATAAPAEPRPSPDAPSGPPQTGGRRLWSSPAAVALLAPLLVAIGLLVSLHPWQAPMPHGPNLKVVARFENLTHDPVFDRTLAKALEIDLGQSPLVEVETDRQVQDAMALMTRPRDEALTSALADEVCARTNAQTVVDGAIAAMGAQYLLTLTATACDDGRLLAAEKSQVGSREAVIPALDGLIRRLRSRLGEPAGSIERFDIPLAQEKTASLAALKAYSEASWLALRGQRLEAMALLRHAIDVDPDFATAYAGLAALSYNLDQAQAARTAITRAYQLRDTVNERERFHIITLYDTIVSADYDETVRATRAWTRTYPLDFRAWIDLANAETAVGLYADAAEAGRRALALNAGSEAAYAEVARPLMEAGRLDEAQSVCAAAVARNLAGSEVHSLIAELAVARGDRAALAQAVASQKGKADEPPVLIVAARDAYRRGEVRRGDGLYARAAELFKAEGLADSAAGPRARDLANLGLGDRARSEAALAATQSDLADLLFVRAAMGDAAGARSAIDGALTASPSNTLLRSAFAPEARAMLALRDGRPLEAVSNLEAARWRQSRSGDIPYLRGRAFLAAHDGARAAAEFRIVLAQPGADPPSPVHSLARLGLARALRLQGDRAGAQQAYAAFLTDWSGADPDLPPLMAAKAEAATL